MQIHAHYHLYTNTFVKLSFSTRHMLHHLQVHAIYKGQTLALPATFKTNVWEHNKSAFIKSNVSEMREKNN